MAEEIVNKPVVETPEERRKRLAAERQARIQGYSPSVDKGKLASSQQYVDQMQKLAADPTYMPSDSTAEERKTLQDILDKAQQQFEEAQNRAEWQDVAQTLSKALVQYGAARRGGENMDLSNISQPTVDYGARINAAQNTLAQRQKTALSKFELDKQAKSEEAKQLADEYRSIADALEAGRKTAQAREENESAYRRALAQASDNNKETPKTVDPQILKRYDKEIEDSQKEEAELQKTHTAATKLFNNKSLIEDMSTKSADKMEAQLGQIAAEAGIDLSWLADELEKTDDKKAWWNKARPEERKAVISSILKDKLDALNAAKQNTKRLKAEKDTLLGITPPTQAQPTPAPAQKPEASSKVTPELIKQYAAKHNVTEDKAREVLTKILGK